MHDLNVLLLIKEWHIVISTLLGIAIYAVLISKEQLTWALVSQLFLQYILWHFHINILQQCLSMVINRLLIIYSVEWNRPLEPWTKKLTKASLVEIIFSLYQIGAMLLWYLMSYDTCFHLKWTIWHSFYIR